jgi:DNA polymerase-3 subunit beta
MKITFQRKEIIDAISPLMCAVSGKSTLTAAEGILMEAKAPDTVTLTTFDLEKGVRITIHPEVLEEGSYIINAAKFNQTVKAMSSAEFTLTVDNTMTATFEAGKFSYKMGALPGSDFPETPQLSGENGFVVKQGVFKKMLSKVMHAMALNDQRPVLNGCFVKIVDDNLQMIACDTFRIAKCAVSTDMKNVNTSGAALNTSFIIPNKTVMELNRMFSDDEEEEVCIYMNRKNMMFTLGDVCFFSRLIIGEYMDVERATQMSQTNSIILDREPLLEALERASLITEERIAGYVRAHVKLDIEEDTLKIEAVSAAGSTYDELWVEHQGEDQISIALNNRYIIDALRACSADRVKLELSSARSPIYILPAEDDEDSSEFYFLLPIRA